MTSRSELARKIARCIGLRTFRNHWDRTSLLDDCESMAWQLEVSALATSRQRPSATWPCAVSASGGTTKRASARLPPAATTSGLNVPKISGRSR